MQTKNNRKQVTLVGIGMGNHKTMTEEVKDAISNATVLIGAKRMLAEFFDSGKECNIAIAPEHIRDLIESSQQRSFVVLFSGDVSFFSGAKKLLSMLDSYETKVLPGISSLSYFCAKTGISYEETKIISMHGRDVFLPTHVRRNSTTFVLTDGKVSGVCQQLIENGLAFVKVIVGEELSYEKERIRSGTPKDFLEGEFSSLTVLMIQNEQFQSSYRIGIPEEEFIRGDVPMTKSEVRAIAISKLRLKKTDIAYDIGAGTGSVSIEMGLLLERGSVYAIETNPEACDLIEQNKQKFGVNNIQIVKGIAPEALAYLEAPDVVFIGGSKGKLEEIFLTLFHKNHSFRVVIAAITLETLSEGASLIEKYEFFDVEILQASISKTKKVGDYHMLFGQNPTFLLCGTYCVKEGNIIS